MSVQFPPSRPATVQRYLEEGALKMHPVERAEVEARMRKAMMSAADAAAPSISNDTVVQLAYQAQMQAAMALLHVQGLRTKSGDPSHHYRLIDAVRAFAKEEGNAELVRALDELDVQRQRRARSIYEQDFASDDEANEARAAMGAMLPAATASLQRVLRTVP
ncbi:MAG: hypothetical protein ACYC7F_01035 [Gemmatimonadaceae bacterium]